MKRNYQLISLQIDLARQKESVEYIKNYIDFAKANGYNSLFLYLEATVRVPCVSFFTEDESYSVEEIKEIVAYGNEKGIDIIPALENLAHVENFLRHKELAFVSECQDAASEGRGMRTGLGFVACVSNPKATEFMDTYFSQVISLFTSNYVHAGMDEPFDFGVCPLCTERMENGETIEDLFYGHIMRTYKLIKSFGKTMMMWDDFFQYMHILDRLPRDIIMCNWNYWFIPDEPPGMWTNRNKSDWFRLYDQLGFKYMFCTFANETGNLFNVDSFTDYADKYHPIGALMTVWERAFMFYECSYPVIAYAGRFWSGKAKKEDRVKIFTEFLGSEEAAKLVLSLEAYGLTFQANNMDVCENFNQARYDNYNVTGYAVERLKELSLNMEEGLQKDVLLGIYDFMMNEYVELSRQKLSLEIFDNYESRRKKPAYFIEKVNKIKEMNREVYTHGQQMWEKYRKGIKPFDNPFNFDNFYMGREKTLDDMLDQLEKNEKRGVFYAELMMHCFHGSPKYILEIHYKDKTVPATTYRGTAKVFNGVNTIRFAMENKAIDYVLFTIWGEGAIYPCHFRYTYGGKKYMVSSVTKVKGEAKNLKQILSNDTQFAELGSNDGMAHFRSVKFSRTEHQIKLKFKKFTY